MNIYDFGTVFIQFLKISSPSSSRIVQRWPNPPTTSTKALLLLGFWLRKSRFSGISVQLSGGKMQQNHENRWKSWKSSRKNLSPRNHMSGKKIRKNRSFFSFCQAILNFRGAPFFTTLKPFCQAILPWDIFCDTIWDVFCDAVVIVVMQRTLPHSRLRRSLVGCLNMSF